MGGKTESMAWKGRTGDVLRGKGKGRHVRRNSRRKQSRRAEITRYECYSTRVGKRVDLGEDHDHQVREVLEGNRNATEAKCDLRWRGEKMRQHGAGGRGSKKLPINFDMKRQTMLS